MTFANTSCREVNTESTYKSMDGWIEAWINGLIWKCYKFQSAFKRCLRIYRFELRFSGFLGLFLNLYLILMKEGFILIIRVTDILLLHIKIMLLHIVKLMRLCRQQLLGILSIFNVVFSDLYCR